jgi:AcrR family transcriptional regulator
MASKAQNTRKSPARNKASVRINDAEASRADILATATKEFSEKGLSGARVDSIAERTKINKRMIYYYFGSKEGLYRAVLERCYGHIRMSESAVELDSLPPEEALRQHVRLTFDYHSMHPDFVRLVMNENIHQAAHIGELASIRTRNRAVIKTLRGLLDRGIEAGLFRSDIEPVELHMSISALCFYNVSNRYTFSKIFERDMTSASAVAARREVVVDMIMRWMAAPAKPQRGSSSR